LTHVGYIRQAHQHARALRLSPCNGLSSGGRRIMPAHENHIARPTLDQPAEQLRSDASETARYQVASIGDYIRRAPALAEHHLPYMLRLGHVTIGGDSFVESVLDGWKRP
jgi:hypothetical protein